MWRDDGYVFCRPTGPTTNRTGVLSKALRVARNLDDLDLAAMLLASFRVETLARAHAALVLASATATARSGRVTLTRSGSILQGGGP